MHKDHPISAVPLRFNTIGAYYKFRGLPAPAHPLVSVMDLSERREDERHVAESLVFDFYSISLKRVPDGRIRYGQHSFEFDEGVMFFIAPGQVFGVDIPTGSLDKRSGFVLLVHPDLFLGTGLARKIRSYEFFGYAVHEALQVSAKEEEIVTGLMHRIDEELRANIDSYSQDVIVAHIELLLTYSQRFFNRQFLTRRVAGHQLLEGLEALLDAYFSDGSLARNGLPSVQYFADALHVSSGYLSGMLRALTGRSTQQQIHDRLIEKAKELISTTRLSVSEIAYELGFEHAQSFSKLFKSKTSFSPLEFRQSFN